MIALMLRYTFDKTLQAIWEPENQALAHNNYSQFYIGDDDGWILLSYNVSGIIWNINLERASNAELWCFVCCSLLRAFE